MTHVIQRATPDDMPDVLRIDDDATTLYAGSGFPIVLAASHPFVVAEQDRWRRSAELGRLFFAVDGDGARLGFGALDELDDAPYLDQLSVCRGAMRRGVGRFLLRHAIDWARAQGASQLWLTTYGHLPWNRPFYEQEGFQVVPEAECGPAVRHHLSEQRRWLPAPRERVAMRRALSSD
jgi:GNAT superfamily N-acetyltransferase